MSDRPETLVGDSATARAVAVGLLASIAVIHLGDISAKFEEVPYLGVGYVLLIVACVIAAGLLTRREAVWRDRGWLIGGGVAGLTLLGYVLTRTVGLPAATDDKGNWSETLGVWSMITEGAMVVLATAALLTSRRTARALA